MLDASFWALHLKKNKTDHCLLQLVVMWSSKQVLRGFFTIVFCL